MSIRNKHNNHGAQPFTNHLKYKTGFSMLLHVPPISAEYFNVTHVVSYGVIKNLAKVKTCLDPRGCWITPYRVHDLTRDAPS